jgi:acyl-CoA thioesterase
MTPTAQQLAQATADAMYRNDQASQALGMELEAVAPGYARMSMTVRPDMLNGHATCHGGMIFSLADSAFAFACNSHNINTVAAGCSIEFLKPAHGGDRLTAEAHEQALSGRQGVYDIRVTKQDGTVIALFRGKSAQIRGQLVPLAE